MRYIIIFFLMVLFLCGSMWLGFEIAGEPSSLRIEAIDGTGYLVGDGE